MLKEVKIPLEIGLIIIFLFITALSSCSSEKELNGNGIYSSGPSRSTSSKNILSSIIVEDEIEYSDEVVAEINTSINSELNENADYAFSDSDIASLTAEGVITEEEAKALSIISK